MISRFQTLRDSYNGQPTISFPVPVVADFSATTHPAPASDVWMVVDTGVVSGHTYTYSTAPTPAPAPVPPQRVTSRLTSVQQSCSAEPTEFAVGSVVAYRRGRVSEQGVITGARHQPWVGGENVAICLPQSVSMMWWWGIRDEVSLAPADHTSPGDRCSCGFYAFNTPNPAGSGFDSGYSDTHMVDTMVEFYGKVMIGTKGLRAEKARIVAMRVEGPWQMTVVPVPALGAASEELATAINMVTSVKPGPPDPGVINYLEVRYPGVPMFDTLEEMVEAFPISEILKGTPGE